jgi:hypothetical protein
MTDGFLQKKENIVLGRTRLRLRRDLYCWNLTEMLCVLLLCILQHTTTNSTGRLRCCHRVVCGIVYVYIHACRYIFFFLLEVIMMMIT